MASTSSPVEQAADIGGPSSDRDKAMESWNRLMKNMSENGGVEKPVTEEDRQKLERDWEKCQSWKKTLMTQSPVVTFMLKHLELAGCPFDASAIQCHPCDERNAGGFHPDYGVLLCQNRFKSKKHMEQTMTHELIHAFDHCRFNVDWNNLRHHACSEIRAANLSGDCRLWNEMWRGYFGFSKHHQTCVKRRATISILANPACKDREMAERVVNEVWSSCWKDTRPFDKIY